LAARDQVILVSPGTGLKQLPIRAAESDGTRTTLTLTNDLGGDFTSEWVAIPLERQQKMSVPGALLSVLGIALGLGLVHGLLVTRMKLPPFVVTLCGLLIYRGVSRWLVSDQPVGFGKEFEGTLSPLGSGKLVIREWVTDGRTETFGIPYPFFIALAVAIVAAVFLNRTIWGRYLLALGRNEDAARYSGINTGRITLVAYVICTVLAATGGILFALDSNSISPSSFGNFFELYAIAAAVLGGCSLRGGEGSIIGVIIGTAVMQVLYNLVVLMKISDTLEFAIIGAVILVGVVADELVRRLSTRQRAVDTST
jgi:ribose transport system permease protein